MVFPSDWISAAGRNCSRPPQRSLFTCQDTLHPFASLFLSVDLIPGCWGGRNTGIFRISILLCMYGLDFSYSFIFKFFFLILLNIQGP